MHDHLHNQDSALHTPHSRLSEALAFYGMGEMAEAVVERVAVVGVVESLTETAVIVLVSGEQGAVSSKNGSQITARGSLPQKRCEFLRSEVTVQYFSAERACIRIPKAYLPAFCLWRYELTGHQLAEVERLVACHNAPYLKTSVAKPEKIGNLRI